MKTQPEETCVVDDFCNSFKPHTKTDDCVGNIYDDREECPAKCLEDCETDETPACRKMANGQIVKVA